MRGRTKYAPSVSRAPWGGILPPLTPLVEALPPYWWRSLSNRTNKSTAGLPVRCSQKVLLSASRKVCARLVPRSSRYSGRVSKKKKQPRDPPISYRVPVALKALFYPAWEKSGLSISAFITQCIRQALKAAPEPRQRRKPSIEKELLEVNLRVLIEIKEQTKTIPLMEEGVVEAIRGVDQSLIDSRNFLMGKAGYRT